MYVATDYKKIHSHLFDLVRIISPDLPEDKTKKLIRDTVQRVCEDFTQSQSTVLDDEDTVLQRAENRLIQLHKEHSISKLHDANRILKLTNCSVPRASIITLLLKLSEKKIYSSFEGEFRSSKRHQKSSENLSFTHLGNGDCSPTIISKPFPRPSSFGRNPDSARKSHHESSREVFNNSSSPIAKLFQRANVENKSVPSSPAYKSNKVFVSEHKLLLDLIECMQGIPCGTIKMDPNGEFSLDPQIQVNRRDLVDCILEVGYWHNKVIKASSNLAKGGHVSQSVHSAIRLELIDFYGFISAISSRITGSGRKDDTPLGEEDSGCHFSLHTLFVAVQSPLRLLITLSNALTMIGSSQGGAIVSALYNLSHHGDPAISRPILSLLTHSGKQIMRKIQYWLVLGELLDDCDEFFITAHKSCEERDIWHSKFFLRENLVPNVISKKQADMILKAGKAVHFLNVICNKRCPVSGYRKKLNQLKDPELLDLLNQNSELSQLIVHIFEEISAQVLDTLVNEFKLFEHFEGMKKYIFLCQGDFANYLMDFLDPEMQKKAEDLQTYRLTGLLDAAIRSSSAAFEDPEIISKVTVKLLVASPGDCGYDVFGLHYVMHDSIDAAFKLHEGAYSNMFNFLWRTKRMWRILQSLVKERWSVKRPLAKLCKAVPEVSSVLELPERLSVELVHFAREMLCYLLFEVIECVWDDFSATFRKAKTLDDVIVAHDLFISTILAQTFQDPESKKFINDLRLIWDLVSDLEGLEKKFLERCLEEFEEREDGTGTTSYKQEADQIERDRKFHIYLSSVRAQYTMFIRNYQDVIKKFLLELSMTKNHQLRMLSSRLDYNEYYKRNDSRITDSMKFSRCSDIYSDCLT